MTVSNTQVSETYDGDGIQVEFAIPFNFQPGQASSVTKVILIAADDTETTLVEGDDYNLLPLGDNPTKADLSDGTTPNGAPGGAEKVRVERVTPRTQPSDLDAGGSSTPYSPVTVENALDRAVRILQEIDASLTTVESATSTNTLISGALVPDWVSGEDYTLEQIVIFNLRIYRALVTHTSGGDFNTDLVASKWELVKTQGTQGLTGPQGATGATGSTGAKGDQGPAGSDGVFSEIANQAEAEAGVNNTKGMSPLGTKQAINDQVGTLRDTDFPALVTRVTSAEESIAVLNNKVSKLEGASQVSRATGSQRVLNNQSTAVPIIGKDSSVGAGERLELNPVGATSAQVMVEIYRKDDAEERFVRASLELHYISGTWYLGTKNIITLQGEDSGVNFEVSQDGDNVAQVSYTSDDMVGGNYDSASYLRYLIEEIPATLGF